MARGGDSGGTRGLRRWPPSCRRLVHWARHRQVGRAAEARRPAPLGLELSAGRQRTHVRGGRGFARKAHRRASLLCPSTSSRFKSYALSPSKTRCPCSLSFYWIDCRLLTKHKAAILKVPEGRASKAVTGRADGSNPLGLSRVTVSRRGWLLGRNLKIWAKDHTLKTQRRCLNRSRGQATLGGLAPSRPWPGRAAGGPRLGCCLRKTRGRSRFPTERAPAGSPGYKRLSDLGLPLAPESREGKERLAKGSRANGREVKAA